MIPKRKISKILSIVLCISLILSTFAFADAGEPKDYEGHWAEESIKALFEKGIITGYEDGSFKPDKEISRAEFMAIVNRAFEFNEESVIEFSDVKVGEWHYEHVARAVKAGYIKGFTDGTMRPTQNITKQEAAVIITRILDIETNTAVLASIKDGDKIPEWSAKGVAAIISKGYINPNVANEFEPTKLLTRAEMAAAVERSYAKAIKKVYATPGIFTGGNIDGSVKIDNKNVTLLDTVISGNLILGEGIGEGDVHLINVTVKGDTIVRGGGESSIILDNCQFSKIIIIKEDNKIRILARRGTSIDASDVLSGGILESEGAEGEGFGYVTIAEALDEDSLILLIGNFESVEVRGEGIQIQASGGTIGNLVVAETATNVNIELEKDAKVTTLTADAPTTVTGEGKIDTAKVSTSGSKIDVPVAKMEKPKDVEVEWKEPEKPKPSSSGGGGGGSSSGGGTTTVKVSGITVTTESGATEINTKGGKLQLKANVEPSGASNKSVTWSFDDNDTDTGSASIDNITGLLTAIQDGTVTVKATANDGSGVVGKAVITISGQEEILEAPVDGLKNLDITGLTTDNVKFLVFGLMDGKAQKVATLAEVKGFIEEEYKVTFNTNAIKVEEGKISIDGSILSKADWRAIKAVDPGNSGVPYKITVLKEDKTNKVAKIAMYEDGNAVIEDLQEPKPDTTAPEFKGITPATGNIELAHDENLVIKVKASDENLKELEIDHSLESILPEFSVYASATDPYGGDGEAFGTAGVVVTYDEEGQEWTIDFGKTVTDTIVDKGGITFYLVLKDEAGNQWGSMYEVTEDNTFKYTITRLPKPDTTAPEFKGITPAAGNIELAHDENLVIKVKASDENLKELEIDHSLESILPEFSVYASATDPYGGDGEAFGTAGVVVTYDEEGQEWTIDFGKTVTDTIVDKGGITLYLVLKDEAGNQWGSMYEVTEDNTFKYTITRLPKPDTTAPEFKGITPAAGNIELAHDENLVIKVKASDENLKELEIDHSLESILPEFSVYASATDPYGGDGEAFGTAGVVVTYDEEGQEWTIDFGKTVTDTIVDKGGITLYLVLKDEAGNQWGSMYEVTEDNTFKYTITRLPKPDTTAPEFKGITPAAGNIELAHDENLVIKVKASDENLKELEIDHSLESILPEFSVYASATDPYGGDGEAFGTAGVVVTYDEEGQEWTIDFGKTVTDTIVDKGGITFYLVLKDEAGNQWGSMYEVTEDNTFKYTITQDEDPAAEIISATWEPTGAPGINNNKLYTSYKLMAEETQISLDLENVSSITEEKPDGTTVKLTPDSGTLLWFNVVTKAAGDYKYTIETKAGDIYEATLTWDVLESIEAEKQGEDLVKCGDGIYRYHYKISLAMEKEDTFVYRIKPTGDIDQQIINDDSDDFSIYFRPTGSDFTQLEGNHTYVIKKGDDWYTSVITYEEPDTGENQEP